MMVTETVVQIIGLVIVLSFIFFGIDDLLWDVYSLFRGKSDRRVDPAEIERKLPRMLAIAVAAWHESAVLGEVVENLIRSTNYPEDMYRVFLGVYPNDPETIAVVDSLAARYPGIVKSVTDHEGPTSKADNLNHILNDVALYEREHHIRFVGITVHDSEDVVHPLELKMTNYLIDDHDALQFPVFPLMRMPRFGNFLKTLTVGTYADEFAEHHYRTLVMRDRFGFVPSAGTGFCINRSFLDRYGDGRRDIMPEDNLTEDYSLSLHMSMAGYRVHYVLERVVRIDARGRRFWDYISTRSMFPQRFGLAVRQKTRWIYGITMQSSGLRDVFADNGLTFRERTFLYKDLKAKFANFVLIPGYLVFAYVILQAFVLPSLPLVYPFLSVGWWLCIFLTIMMVERQFFRGASIVRVYGKRMMFFACLLPPLFPIRLIWGNVINVCATARAWVQKVRFDRLTGGRSGREEEEPGTSATTGAGGDAVPPCSNEETAEIRRDIPEGGGSRPRWAKTDHEFLPENILKRYRRLYGDFLLAEAIDEHHLEQALREEGESRKPLGRRLLEEGVVSEWDLAVATAAQNKTVSVTLTPSLLRMMELGDAPAVWSEAGVWPVLETARGTIALVSDQAGSWTVREFERLEGKPLFMLVVASEPLASAIRTVMADGVPELTGTGDARYDLRGLRRLCDEGVITLAQAGIALGHAVNEDAPLESVLREMGLIR